MAVRTRGALTRSLTSSSLAQQKKLIKQTSIDKRKIWGFERRYWLEEQFRHYECTDECHFACALQRQARIHCRRGKKARNAPQKIQSRFRRRNQVWQVFGEIGWKPSAFLNRHRSWWTACSSRLPGHFGRSCRSPSAVRSHCGGQ